MLALSLKEKKQEEKQQNRRQQATAFALNKSSNKTVDKAPADRTYIAVVCAPLPPRCVREWLRACVLCLSVWESELCLGRRMRALRLRIAPCNEGIAHYNTDGGQQQQQQATTRNNNNEQRRGTTRAGHVVANQFPIGNGAFLPANHKANRVQCGHYRQQQAAPAGSRQQQQ